MEGSLLIFSWILSLGEVVRPLRRVLRSALSRPTDTIIISFYKKLKLRKYK